MTDHAQDQGDAVQGGLTEEEKNDLIAYLRTL